MSMIQTDEAPRQRRLRLWPGVALVVMQWLARFGIKLVVPGFEGFKLSMMGSILCTLAIALWWAFFSRATRLERWGGTALMIVSLAAAWSLRHESMDLPWLLGYAVPVLSLALVAWAVTSRRLADGPRRATMAATIVLVSGVWLLVRTDGITGDHVSKFAWRWTETPEDNLLADAGDEPSALALTSTAAEPPEQRPVSPVGDESRRSAGETGTDWPGFRGPGRDGIVRGVRIETDWAGRPPVEMWRRRIGPGWSSFAVRGDLLYTQEQRGKTEVVSCYKATTGQPVWTHRDAARFFESNAGAGPRGTPTLSNGRVYTFGATGILNALDARNGSVVWTRNAASDTGATVPYWGFSSSPLVVGDVVIVATAGQLIAYDCSNGNPRWRGPAGGGSYSSPHQVTIDGVTQILLQSDSGAISVAPADGKRLWEHSWPGSPIVQPALTANGDVLIAASAESGTRRIAVARGSGEWAVEERWTSFDLKPYFNDFVIHKGHVFGFDARILSCIDLENGERKWKGGRYGNGQLVLLPDQDLLLVLSEEGELALVPAAPEEFKELARFKAIEGKTWNHPVLVGDILLVRNGQEMAAFRLPVVGR